MAKTFAGKQPTNHTEIDIINQAVNDKGVSKNSLADETGIPYKTLCRRLEGDGLLTLRELRKIAAALNIWPSDLLPEDLTAKQVAA
ncbi:helix-turn-helix domain-containing protein [Pseudarthrobacter sp. S6]|uniref:helix-turn-helix domain-containing protein n=1 Tax=Pseudarthrobacter sp. S6 TaxID=3418420 RepID=UPI003CE7BEF3